MSTRKETQRERHWMRERERTRLAEEGKKTEMLNTKKKKKNEGKQK